MRARLEASAAGVRLDHAPAETFTEIKFGEKSNEMDRSNSDAQRDAEREVQDLLDRPRVMEEHLPSLTPMSPLSPIQTGTEFQGYEYQRPRAKENSGHSSMISPRGTVM